MNSVENLIEEAQKIVIIQADNPDGDSLASALALEQILGDLGKEPLLYCGVDIPTYLRYLPGWDRVSRELPKQFDLSIIVDTSSETLLEKLAETKQIMWLKAKPCLVIDHHIGDQKISFATVTIDEPAVSTGEIIYELSTRNNWSLNHEALTMIATSIMADSRGLTTDKTSARSIHIVGELVEKGVSIPELEAGRRASMRRSSDLVHYKGQLLQRVEYHHDNQIATVTIPWAEIEKYSPFYNPTMLVIEDMLLTEGTLIAVGFKNYPDGKTTGKIRTNFGFPVAAQLATAFGGGGHPYASGFKVTDGRTFEDVKQQVITKALELIGNQQKT